MGIGEAAALGAALAWAIASLLYCKTRLTAWQMNLAKNVIAAVVFLAQLVIVTWLMDKPIFAATPRAIGWMCVSGIIGVMIGDTFYFRSLQVLGPRIALVVTTIAPAFGGILGWALLDQPVSGMLWAGIFTTTTGIAWVVSSRTSKDESPGLYPGSIGWGVLMGVLASLCQALGGIASVKGMTEEGCGSLEGSFYRIAVSGLLMCVFTPGIVPTTFQRVFAAGTRASLIPAILMGTWMGIWLSQIAFEFTSVAVTLTLLATTPLFILPMMWCFYRQEITDSAIFGAVLAIAGVILTVMARPESISPELKKQDDQHIEKVDSNEEL